jgi:hypothetical protein
MEMIIYTLILLYIAFMWRPSANSRRYSYAQVRIYECYDCYECSTHPATFYFRCRDYLLVWRLIKTHAITQLKVVGDHDDFADDDDEIELGTATHRKGHNVDGYSTAEAQQRINAPYATRRNSIQHDTSTATILSSHSHTHTQTLL